MTQKVAPTSTRTYDRVRVDRFGGPDALRIDAVPHGPLRPGHVRIRVLAAGVGMTDLMARDGDYLLQRRTPFTPGYEAVGVIEEVAPARPGSDRRDSAGEPGAADLPSVGETVAVVLEHMGAYSTYLDVPNERAVRVPAGLDPVTAAAVPLDHLTAISALDTHARVRPGGTLLVHGAGGGVGQALVAQAMARGLRVVGTASAVALDALRDQGMIPVDYRTADLGSALRRVAPDGYDAVIDHLGGATSGRNLRLLRRGGVLVQVAFAGRPGRMVGDTARGALRLRLAGALPGRGTAVVMVPRQIRRDPGWYRCALATALQQADDGVVRPRVRATFPLGRVADAHRAQADRSASGAGHDGIPGKIVLVTDGAA